MRGMADQMKHVEEVQQVIQSNRGLLILQLGQVMETCL